MARISSLLMIMLTATLTVPAFGASVDEHTPLKGSILESLGIVWIDQDGGSIRYEGSAFQVAVRDNTFWVTAAHVAYDAANRAPQVYISPSRLQKHGKFPSSELTRPKYFLAGNAKEVRANCEKKISLSYTYSAGPSGISEPHGNDVCLIDGVSNFPEARAFPLRDLNQHLLANMESLFFAGYPADGLGKLLLSSCKFHGFTMDFGDFRGLLFCTSSTDTVGYSGGPILDREGRVVGALSSNLESGMLGRIDHEGHNKVIYFTPLISRGSSIDGFNQGEIEKQRCVETKIVGSELVLSESGACKQ